MIQTFFRGKMQHLFYTASADMPILKLFANNNGNFRIIPQRNISHQLALVFNIKALPMGTEIIVHTVQQL